MNRRRTIFTAFIALALGAAATLTFAVVRSLFPAWVSVHQSGFFRSGPYVCGSIDYGGFGFHGCAWTVDSKDSVLDYARRPLAEDPRLPPSWSTCWDNAVVERLWNAHSLTANLSPTQCDQGVGWPFIALHAHRDWAGPGVHLPWAGAYNLSPRFIPGSPTATSVERCIPLQPVWSGLIGNTLFFAAALWILAAGSVRLRRHLRLRRGACAVCNYSLRGLQPNAPCPECGTAPPASRV